MSDLIWKELSTFPKGGKVVIGKDKNNREFYCHYAPIPESIGYYGYIELIGYPKIVSLKEASPLQWRNL